MEDKNNIWESKMAREHELNEAKRRRPSELEDEDSRTFGERRCPKRLR